MRPAKYQLGVMLITVSAVAWSTAGLFTRLIPLDSWTMLVWRGLFGAFGIAAVILALERRNAVASFQKMNWPSWLYAGLGALAMVFYITSLKKTSVAHVAVIYATAPFLAAALGWLVMREKPALSAIAASLVALAGVVVMVGLGMEGGLFGDLLAFGMTLSMAVIIIVARHSRNIPVMPAACLAALVSGLVSWPFGDPLAVSGYELLLLAAFGLVNSALGLALFTLGARFLPATETALIGSLDAPLAPLWVWLVFNETPGGSTMMGGAIVFVAVAAHLIAGASRIIRPSSWELLHRLFPSGEFFSLYLRFWLEPIQWLDVFIPSQFKRQGRIMQQHSNGRELVPTTTVTTDEARQGVTGHGVRYVLTFGLLGVIFVFAMMLVIFAS